MWYINTFALSRTSSASMRLSPGFPLSSVISSPSIDSGCRRSCLVPLIFELFFLWLTLLVVSISRLCGSDQGVKRCHHIGPGDVYPKPHLGLLITVRTCSALRFRVDSGDHHKDFCSSSEARAVCGEPSQGFALVFGSGPEEQLVPLITPKACIKTPTDKALTYWYGVFKMPLA